MATVSGAIGSAGDSIPITGWEFRKDAADIVGDIPCHTRTQLEGFDRIRDCRTINTTQGTQLFVAQFHHHSLCSSDVKRGRNRYGVPNKTRVMPPELSLHTAMTVTLLL